MNSPVLHRGINAVHGGAGVVTFSAAADYTLTVPATGTAALLNQANSFTLINPLTTIAESWIGPSSTTGIYFKGGLIAIGETAAGQKLRVNGDIGIRAGSALSLYDSANADYGYIKNAGTSSATMRLAFITDLEALSILKNGDLGCGVAAALYKLDVRNNSTTKSQLHFAHANADYGGYLTSVNAGHVALSGGVAWDGSNWIAKFTSATIITGNSDVITMSSNTGLTAGVSFTPAEKWRLDSTGKMTLVGWQMFSGADSTQESPMLQIVPSYVVNTHASYTSRTVFSQWAIGGAQEVMRMESGAEPMWGVFGAAAVKQTGHAAPTDLPTALTFCAAIRTALQNLGFITTVA